MEQQHVLYDVPSRLRARGPMGTGHRAQGPRVLQRDKQASVPAPFPACQSPRPSRHGPRLRAAAEAGSAGLLAFGRSGTLEAGERGTARDASGAHTLIGVHAAAAADHPITDALGWRRTSPFRYASCPCPPDVAIVICPISGGRCAHGPWPPTTPAWTLARRISWSSSSHQ